MKQKGTNKMKDLLANEIINKSIYIVYDGLCKNMIEQEMVKPMKYDLTIERKRADYREFEFERKVTELLAPERLERRATYDTKNYRQVYSFE